MKQVRGGFRKAFGKNKNKKAIKEKDIEVDLAAIYELDDEYINSVQRPISAKSGKSSGGKVEKQNVIREVEKIAEVNMS